MNLKITPTSDFKSFDDFKQKFDDPKGLIIGLLIGSALFFVFAFKIYFNYKNAHYSLSFYEILIKPDFLTLYTISISWISLGLFNKYRRVKKLYETTVIIEDSYIEFIGKVNERYQFAHLELLLITKNSRVITRFKNPNKRFAAIKSFVFPNIDQQKSFVEFIESEYKIKSRTPYPF